MGDAKRTIVGKNLRLAKKNLIFDDLRFIFFSIWNVWSGGIIKLDTKFSFSIYYEVEEKFKGWFFLLRLKYSKQKIGAK